MCHSPLPLWPASGRVRSTPFPSFAPCLSQFTAQDEAAAAALARQAFGDAGLLPAPPAPEVAQMDDGEAAPAAAPAASPAAADDTVDVLHDNPGYLLMFYGPEVSSEDRVPLNLASCGSMLKELNQLAIEMDNFPLFESNDIALKGARGPITAHGLSWDDASRFAETNECLTAELYDQGGKIQQVTFQIKATCTDLQARLGLKDSFASGFNPVKIDHLKLHGGWIEVRQLTDEQMDLKFNIMDVQKALGIMRIKVCRKVHVQAKIADDENENRWLPLGAEYRTDRMKITVKPVDCPLGSYDWSQFPTIPCTKVVVF